MLIRLSRRWPFIARADPPADPVPPPPPVTDTPPHRSWVRTSDGHVGWIEYHTGRGFMIRLRNGTRREVSVFENLPGEPK